MKEQAAANGGKKFPFRGNDVPVAFPKPKPLSRKFLSEGFHQATGKSLCMCFFECKIDEGRESPLVFLRQSQGAPAAAQQQGRGRGEFE